MPVVARACGVDGVHCAGGVRAVLQPARGWGCVCREAKGTSGGFAAMFSACDDSQLAADTVSFGGLYHTGVATSCFVEACFQIHAQRNQFTCAPP